MSTPTPTHLYHYACAHAAPQIRRSGVVRPNPMAALQLAWFTDLAVPDRDKLGLTSMMLACDRTEFRFLVAADDDRIVPWPVWCRVQGVGRRARERYEASPGAAPLHWWVAAEPVEVVA